MTGVFQLAQFPTMSWQITLLVIAGSLTLFACGAFVILGSFLTGSRQWYMTLLVLVIATALIWQMAQHSLGNNIHPTMGNFGG